MSANNYRSSDVLNAVLNLFAAIRAEVTREIARYLGVTYQTAINDIHWLRKRHLI